MMKSILRGLFMALLVSILSLGLLGTASAQVAILCYHEVDRDGDAYAVTKAQFERHIALMKKEGYRFINLDEYIAYTEGRLNLPDKSVMITFDDGYDSFYTKVYPILKREKVPAMLAIVTSWTDGEDKPIDVRDTASWEALREMEASGLVTVVSHSHALHKQQAIDPQGDRFGVGAYRLYFNNRYETDEEYRARLNNDMAKVQEEFQQYLGHPSKALVWPYGMASGESIAAAKAHGMEATFLLDGGVNDVGEMYKERARRMIIGRMTDDKSLERLLTVNHDALGSDPIRFAQVDIDNVYDKNPTVMRENLQNLRDQLENNHINLVALQAFADPDGDGNVDSVWFKNSVIPVKADVYNMVANTIQQANIHVVAWMPGLAYLPLEDGGDVVVSTGEKGWYKRISPFDKALLPQVAKLYRELSAYTTSEGVLFQDDLYMNDTEDASLPAQAAFQQAFHRPLTQAALSDKKTAAAWMSMKTQALTDWSKALAAAFKENRPDGVILRDIYTDPVLDPASESWFAQNYKDFLKDYDYTVVMAYPYMDEADDADAYLKNIADHVKAAGGNDKTIVKIQSYDWSDNTWVDGETFLHQLNLLKKLGIRNMGYYPNTYMLWK